mgnify:CR=1 FL=1
MSSADKPQTNLCRVALLALMMSVCGWTALAQEGELSGAEERMLKALIGKFSPLPSVERIWTGAFEKNLIEEVVVDMRAGAFEALGVSWCCFAECGRWRVPLKQGDGDRQ